MLEFNTVWFELAIVNAGFAFGSILFGHFEEHTHKLRKVLKLILFNTIIALLYLFLGRAYSLGFIIFKDQILFFKAFPITPIFNNPGKASGKIVITLTLKIFFILYILEYSLLLSNYYFYQQI